MLPDGSWVTRTWEELEAEDPEAARDLRRPIIPLDEMPADERHFYEKMQDQHETNASPP